MSKSLFRPLLRCLAMVALSCLAVAGGTAHAADNYPSRPIKLLVPFPAGGPTDYLARRVASGMEASLGQPVVVDNRGGAAGVIATETAARSEPDGYTVLLGTGTTFSINPHILQNLPYKVDDFEPISLVARAPWVLVAGPGAGVKSCKEMVAAAKAHPGAMTWAHSGRGSGAHLFGVMATSTMGIDLLGVPYRGEATTDLLGGSVQLMTTTLSATVLSHHQSGRLRILAVASGERLKALPDLATFGDCGYPSVVAFSWFGIFAPAKTPAAIADKLNQAVVKAVSSADLQAQLSAGGFVMSGSTRAELAKMLPEESERWGSIVRTHRIRLD